MTGTRQRSITLIQSVSVGYQVVIVFRLYLQTFLSTKGVKVNKQCIIDWLDEWFSILLLLTTVILVIHIRGLRRTNVTSIVSPISVSVHLNMVPLGESTFEG